MSQVILYDKTAVETTPSTGKVSLEIVNGAFVIQDDAGSTQTTSGDNSGDETTTTIGALIDGATEKSTPVDADMVGLMDSAAANILKKLSWANIKATLKTYFDTLYAAIGAITSSGLTVSATDKVLGRSTAGSGAVEEIACGSYGRSIIGVADEAALKSLVNLEIGTDVQAYDATLQSLSSLGTAADKYAYTTAIDTWVEGDIASSGRSLIAASTAAAQRLLIVVSGHAYISGLICSNNSGDANNDIDITSGECIDSTNASMLVGSAMTKQLDASWAAGTNAGGLDTGSKAVSTEYYIHAILKDSDNTVDYLFSTSRTAPTMPAGYTKFRHIGWCKTDGGGNIIGFISSEMEGGGIRVQWKSPVMDVSLSNTLTTTARTDALSVITGIKVRPLSIARVSDGSSAVYALISDPDTTDNAPSSALFSIVTGVSDNNSILVPCMTNTSRQIRARADIATVDIYSVTTHGFEWSRR